MFTLTLRDFEEVRARIAPHIKHTPLLTSRQLSERTGFDVRLKAEMFQRVGSYKIRGPLNKFAQMPEEQKRRGVVCSSAGNHAQGVALAAEIHGIRAVVCMAENATPAKIAATKGYGAEVVLHGMIWEAGKLETIDCRTIIDGLRVRRVGEINLSVVQRFVDEIVALPDRDIFDAVIWLMERCKLVAEGAAAAPVAALLHGLIKLPAGSRVAVVLSGGNLNLDQLRGLKWN